MAETNPSSRVPSSDRPVAGSWRRLKDAMRSVPFVGPAMRRAWLSLKVLFRGPGFLVPPPSPPTEGALEAMPGCPDLFGDYRRLADCPDLKRVPGGWEYRGKVYPDYLTVGGASLAVARTALRFCTGRGVDVGAGFWPLPGAIPVDLLRGEGADKSIEDFADEELDFVFSSHCLEHIEDWRAALKLWYGKLKAGGVLFIYLPHPMCEIWLPGSPMVGDAHKWVPQPDVVNEALASLGAEILSRDDGPDAMQSFHLAARKR